MIRQHDQSIPKRLIFIKPSTHRNHSRTAACVKKEQIIEKAYGRQASAICAAVRMKQHFHKSINSQAHVLTVYTFLAAKGRYTALSISFEPQYTGFAAKRWYTGQRVYADAGTDACRHRQAISHASTGAPYNHVRCFPSYHPADPAVRRYHICVLVRFAG